MMSRSSKRVAFFDFDHTLIQGDSNQLWFTHLFRRQLIHSNDVARHDQFLDDYRQGQLDFEALQAFRIEIDQKLSPEVLVEERATFAEQSLAPVIFDAARQSLQAHQAEGDTVVIVSATRRCLIEGIAAQLEVDHLITAEPASYVNQYPCFGEGKVHHVEAWLAEQGLSLDSLAKSWFYSDSASDLPLLSVVDTPVAVMPDPRLARHAISQGWQVIEAAL